VAIGALAIGRLAVGRLVIKKARFAALEVDELTVRRLRVLEGNNAKGNEFPDESGALSAKCSKPRQ
jgi:hypothetical protein